MAKRNHEKLFQEFLEEIIDAPTGAALDAIFYRFDGVDQSYQQEKITFDEEEILCKLINKIATNKAYK